MLHKTVKVKFRNSNNPNSKFDLVRLEELYAREDIGHRIEDLHKVEFYLLIFITAGCGYHTIDFTDYNFDEGDVITVRKDQIHKFIKSRGVKGYILLFTDEFLSSYLEKLEALKTLQLFNELLSEPILKLSEPDLTLINDLIDRIEVEYTKEVDDYALSIIRSELHILITKLFRIKAKRNKNFIKKKYLAEFIIFQKLVEDNVVRTNRVNEYAKMMSISTKTLNTITRSILNKSAKEFIDEISIKQIQRLLINTALSVKEIAYASGFNESTNFYKYFKRQVGMTPEQFRFSLS